ncbi:multicopy suppressor of BFA (Brefeldin A) [Rhodotorula toruloides]
MAATRTVPGAAPSGPLTKAQRKAAAQQSAAAPLAASKGDPTAVTVEVKPKDEGSSGRPDKKAYDDEQNELRSQIDVLQAKANDLRNKISSTSVRGGPDHERKLAIRKEMDELRAEQAKGKGGREKTLEKLKQMQDALKRKIDDMTSARSKVPYKTVQDVDNQIKSLERQVESGSMKLVDEKKALSEISSLRKSRKVVESFAAQQAAIDADKAKIDEVRKELDDPEQKAVSKKMSELRKELDEINKKFDDISKNRDGLFEERNAISKQLDELFDKKKASTAAWREANNKYYKKIEEDRQKRDERRKAERKAAEDSKRAEVNQRLLEEAQAPAFEREIEDCKTLIRFFQQRIGLAPANGAGVNGGSLFDRPKVAGVPELEIRKVDSGDMPKGTVLKKKGEQEEESWGGLAKSKGKKSRNAAPAAKEESAAPPTGDEKLNLPFGTLTALMTLGITAPLTTGEVQKTIDSLQLKMKYFTDNQDRVTKERIAAVEAKIAKAALSSGSAEVDAVASTDATATEEKIKDAQPQPIEENGSNEEAVKNAEGETEPEAEAATDDAKEDA